MCFFCYRVGFWFCGLIVIILMMMKRIIFLEKKGWWKFGAL
jgi:hypothetical protein